MQFSPPSAGAPRPPLVCSAHDRLLAGVCAGLADHLGLPALWVRVGMVLLALAGGAGALLYLFFFLTVPREGESPDVVPLRRVFTPPSASTVATTREQGPRSSKQGRFADASTESTSEEPPVSQGWSRGPVGATALGSPRTSTPEDGLGARRPWPIAEVLLGAVFLIAGVSLLLHALGVQLRLEVILPGLAVIAGLGLTWWLIADRDRPERMQLPRVLGALALVAVGVLMFFITAEEPSVLTVIGAALAVLAGVALAVAPWLLQLNRQLVAERSAREREAERAEIAAHLHDSVLQTLALIQQRSEPGNDVARLARAQERELREWLFRTADGAVTPQRDTAEAELTRHASVLEADHSVRCEVVVVGERAVAPEAIIAAAKEAMLNAARHAGGDVTVYLETTGDLVRIEVNDRGPGFDPDAITGERFGVRESIIGRMERAGATARIVPGPGGKGVSVRLEQARVVHEIGAPNTPPDGPPRNGDTVEGKAVTDTTSRTEHS